MHDALLAPVRLGALELANRVVMAPLTRSRARQGDVPWEVSATYYAQRASAGLIVTEATYVDQQGKGYAFVPGIVTDAQVDGWRRVVDAVHGAGGRIALQLWHAGRVGHTDLTPDGSPPVAPSAIRAKTDTYTPTSNGMVEVSMPRALETSEISGVIEAFRRGAHNAKAAGFDAVEIHGANGYILDQFTRDRTNQRHDAYGGDVSARVRLGVEVAEAVSDVFGPGRVGYRISPLSSFNDMGDSNPESTFGTLAERLGGIGLAYLHLIEDGGDERASVFGAIHDRFKGAGGHASIGAGAYSPPRAEVGVRSGRVDAVAFGRLFIANPDLPRRIERGGPYNEWDESTFYGGDEVGYIDYPALEEVETV